ncbi:hypothetical protein DSTSK_39010 [Desulforhabdus sp. TSK]|nr:hypothetical protein DSTSK_39010 [Desulforhabdus sp. TSK]
MIMGSVLRMDESSTFRSVCRGGFQPRQKCRHQIEVWLEASPKRSKVSTVHGKGELPPITDEMGGESLAIIQREFMRPDDLRHSWVRNHLVRLDALGVVPIIREALKR